MNRKLSTQSKTYSSLLADKLKPECACFFAAGIVGRGYDFCKSQFCFEHDLIMEFEVSSAAVTVFSRERVVALDFADSWTSTLKFLFGLFASNIF